MQLGHKVYTNVYICYRYADNPKENIKAVRSICESIVRANATKDLTTGKHFIPIAPHLLFPEFMSEETLGREQAMNYCKSLLRSCKELWVYYNSSKGVTSGMREEISFAGEYGIKIVWKEV